MSLPVMLDAEFCARLALTLAHFLWEGAVIALAAALVSLALRRASSRARYAVWVCALVLMAVSLPATYGLLEPATVAPQIITPAVIKQPEAVEAQSEPPVFTVESSHTEPAPSATAEAQPVLVARQVDWRAYAPYVVLAYLLGVAAMLLRVAVAMGGGRRLRRRSEPVDDPALLESLARQAKTLGLRFTPAAAYCKRIAVPTVVGVIKPAILLPLSLMSGLTPQQIDLLLLHELTHIRRYDPLVNVLQRIVEALLFFHPAVWYVSSRIRVEREHCCDDLVAAHGGAHAYAESLVVAAALAHGLRPSSVGGVAAFDRTSQLRKRITRLLGASEPRVRLMRGGWLLALLAVPLLAFVVAQAASSQTPTGLPPLAGSALNDAIGQLKDPDWWLRQVAAQQLGESGDKTAVMPLIGALKDEDARVQAAAARSLGTMADPRAIKHLVAALKEEGARDAAAEALTKFDPEQVMPLVRVAARDADPEVQLGAVAALERIKPADALDLLMEMIPRISGKGPGINVRGVRLARISEAMEAIDPARAIELLKTGAASPDPAIRNSVKELVTARPFEGMDAVFVSLSQDPAATIDVIDLVMKSAERSIEAGKDPSSYIPETLSALAGAADVRTRAAAVSSAGSLLLMLKRVGKEPQPLIVDVLRNALRDERAAIMGIAAYDLSAANWQPPTSEEDAWFRVAGLVPMSKVERNAAGGAFSRPSNSPKLENAWQEILAPLGKELVAPLIHALQSDGSGVEGLLMGDLNDFRSTAAYSLGMLRAKEAVPALAQALADPSVAAYAARALGDIGDPSAVEPLMEALHRPDPAVRMMAIESLQKLKDPRSVPALLDVLSREQVERIKHGAGQALIAIGDVTAVPELTKLLSNEDELTRAFAVDVLGNLKDRSAVPAIVEMLKSEQSESVKRSAASALGKLGDPAGAESLTSLALGDTARLHKVAVEGLAQLGDAGVAPLIRVLTQSAGEDTRVAAAKQLGDVNSVAAVKALGEAISLDPSGKVSREAALALGRINDPSAVQALVDALDAMSNSDLFLNRADAPIEALALSKEPSSTGAMAQALAKCLNNPRLVVNGKFVHGNLILQLAANLAERGDLRAKPVLEKMSENPGTRVPALAALAKLGGAPPDAEQAATPTPSATTGLEGSTWKLGDFEITFKDATTVQVKGGSFRDGVDCAYKVEDGVFTANVLGETKTGTWDGTALIIDGITAEKQP